MGRRAHKQKRAPARETMDWPTTLFCAAGLLVLGMAAFAPALRNGFVNWDDGPYIVINPTLNDASGLRAIWEPEIVTKLLGQFGVSPPAYRTPIYYPLVFTSFWIERQLGVHKAGKGLEIDRVWGNHAINMFIHALAGILLWRCLVKLRMPPGWAWLASAIWLVHPLQVESVVWAAERKNTMSGLFYFASAWMYLHAGQRMRGKAYAAALFLFVCMMLSKTATMLLPLTLLLIEWLKGRRIGRTALLRVAPFFAIGVLLAATMVSGEQSVVIVETLAARVMIAGQAFWFYLGKLLWPLNAITIYPRWDTTVTVIKMIPLAAALAAGAWWAVAAVRRKPEQSLATAVVLIAVSQYVATVGPALGVVAWPHMDRSFVANHFVYVALVGPIVLLVLGLRRLVQRAAARPKAIQSALLASVIVTALLSTYSFKRSLAWRNNRTLIADILAVNPECPEVLALLSMELKMEGKPDQAIETMQSVVRRKPLYPRARLELAKMLVEYRKDYDGAIEQVRAAIEMQPDMNWYPTLARLLQDTKRYDEALRELDRMTPRNRNSAPTLDLEALILCRMGRWGDALTVSERLVKLRPRCGRAYLYRGWSRLGLRHVPAAERDFQTAVKWDRGLTNDVDAIRRTFISPPDGSGP